MAERIFNALSPTGTMARSAGICTQNGLPASKFAAELCQTVGKHGHRSQQVNEELISWADLILTMTVEHKEWMKQRYKLLPPIETLKIYVGEMDENILDPFGGGKNIYETVFHELERTIQLLIKKINIK